MLDPKQEAIKLIEQYRNASPGGLLFIEPDLANEFALINVQNTIDALEYVIQDIYITEARQCLTSTRLIEHFNQVKEHIKQL